MPSVNPHPIIHPKLLRAKLYQWQTPHPTIHPKFLRAKFYQWQTRAVRLWAQCRAPDGGVRKSGGRPGPSPSGPLT